VGSGREALITDTVGFIRKLPHDLIASFRSTLEEARESDVLLHVIDASHSDWEEHRDVVNGVLHELGLEAKDIVLVFNKIDQITHSEEVALRSRIRAFDATPAVFVSAHNAETLDSLLETLKARLHAQLTHVVVRIPVTDGEAVASLYREGDVVHRVDENFHVSLTARIPQALRGRLASRSGVTIQDMGETGGLL
jgi:GTP-binding protein HflX